MDLILWRHAEAEDTFPDHDRALTALGQYQARRVAQWLTSSLKTPYRVIASPAVRTQSTASALTADFETSRLVGIGASPAQILKAAHWPEATTTVIVVGHQPTLGQTAALLLSGREDNWSVRKGAIWWLSHRDRHGMEQVVLRAVLNPEFI
ncbi:MAG: histidine phosphatase family protein [Betaproteobacteria bacterium]|nr:histidine phosphatase family protein [Betaproteobacteria bacterium]